MSDTPETAAASFNYDTFNGVDPWKGDRFIKVVPAKLAAQLERERDEARAEVEKLQEQLFVAVGMLSAQPHCADRHPEDVRKYIEDITK